MQYTTLCGILRTMITHSSYHRSLVFFGVILGCIGVFAFAATPSRAVFTPNFLLSDYDLTDSTSLSRSGVRDFLRSKGAAIADMQLATADKPKTATDIIVDVARMYRINPKYLLVLLQKEQSLVTAARPTQYQLDWATGAGVPDSGNRNYAMQGFYNQVDAAGDLIRNHYLADMENRGYTISGWGVGITKNIVCLDYEAARGLCTDGEIVPVTPETKATAALYTYTPHLSGNASFVNLWNQWFFRRFPDGTLIRDTTANVYYVIDLGRKRKFRSSTVLITNYDPKKAVDASSSELAAYENGPEIIFANYSLVRNPKGTVFLITNSSKRGIRSMKVFRTLGFNPEEVIRGSSEDLALYPDASAITLSSAYSAGALLRSAKTGGVAYVQNGVRHAIHSKEILKSQFKNVRVSRVSDDELQQYATGDPVLFRDGELVAARGGAGVYFISHGQKRRIASAGAFSQLGFKWKSVVWTTQRSLDIHPDGELLDFADQRSSLAATTP